MLVSSTRTRTSNPHARALLAGLLTAGLALGSAAPAFAQTETPAAAAPAAAPQTNPSAVTAPNAEGTVDVAKLMAPQALPDIVIGKADAPVTIIEYASMTCSHCRDFHSESYPKIKADYLDTGKAKLILREFPFDPRALGAFMLARCAGDDKRTAMVDVLFDQQREWAGAENASAALLKIAQLAGMTQDQFAACLKDTDLQGKVVAVQAAGQNDFGVSATPTFFVNGDKYSGALSADEMAAVIEKHL
ncbi:DsbA family protein [Aureimonas phyllosphaerae]|uniref:Protein-disulfide isomerase n=1 Tax=Aureimonas phyllosphaerae TaxID=1166078 RepID=A0A7W6BRM7_9HYPH|nr:DsbA family protein [Aureimonas phyllosphaerae]MBB3935045.1 protein-disulfide isomerase [Aureimonas phyllosphaerae]MBB3959053.1 protein-disulfide isomerase [Aureimonas phyllosphaerae]SFF08539.1 Protein-disulfide isomerase [Aureimonas phyllosphaerae]